MLIISYFGLTGKSLDNNTNKVTEEIEKITDVEEMPQDNEKTELVNEPDNKDSDYWYYINFPLIALISSAKCCILHLNKLTNALHSFDC